MLIPRKTASLARLCYHQAVVCGPLSIISSLVMMKFRNKCSGASVNEKVNKFVFVV